MSAAQRLDAADGVMDGRFMGRPIVQVGGMQGGFPGGMGGMQGGFPGGMGGMQGGFPQQQFGGGSFAQQSAAQRLDAADGVMDGRFNGRPIVQAGGMGGGFPGQQFGGGFQGQQIIGGGFPGQQFGGGFGGGFAPQSNAAALDAADGVIDGRFHGRPIVQTGGIQQSFGGGFGVPVMHGQSSYIQAPPIVTNSPMGMPMGPGFVQQGFPQGGFAQGGFAQGGFGQQAAAQRLDAADGVMDGQFFGRQIVRQ